MEFWIMYHSFETTHAGFRKLQRIKFWFGVINRFITFRKIFTVSFTHIFVGNSFLLIVRRRQIITK
ncbi:hypothetical protein A3A67_01985 [Candidatus Peribacteria bacterium RIFCSPLOWO2_01_FULL_51_18]|nr:MAG: hypothetical protein A3C52_05370 [Candidatus Peribacteria bacterium RIFCSPHIGHO2_02_FULL_51_15]OGJ65593.1 MAG: hypothetical protein A3A67_01985 [Candidatus Peribacteria bacterium RIFCSPLOWO2_01_FULL_51_18]OGJ68483.1 MAG: hypothetical protein A3J34_02420 [Candidatus Peribacteria bacterium RIFCSPLOWO2_02_FULL_51_10]